MPRIATSYLALAALYFIIGLSLGIGMGVSPDAGLAPLHANVNLIGWTSHALMGLAYRQWPELGRSRMALSQFAIFAVSAPIFLAGLGLAAGYGEPIVAVAGSLGLFAGAILFALMVARLWVSERGTI